MAPVEGPCLPSGVKVSAWAGRLDPPHPPSWQGPRRAHPTRCNEAQLYFLIFKKHEWFHTSFFFLIGVFFPLTFLRFVVAVQLLSRGRLFETPWTAARQASLSITSSRALLQLISIESVMPSSHLTLCRPLLLLPSIFPCITVFSKESVLTSGGQSIGVSASASVLPMNTQD